MQDQCSDTYSSIRGQILHTTLFNVLTRSQKPSNIDLPETRNPRSTIELTIDSALLDYHLVKLRVGVEKERYKIWDKIPEYVAALLKLYADRPGGSVGNLETF